MATNRFWVIVAAILVWLFTLWLVGNLAWHMGWNAHG